MDINEHLQPIVAALLESLKTELEGKLQDRISQEVVAKLAAAELDSVVSDQIAEHISRRLDGFNFVDVSNQQLHKIVGRVTESVTKTLNENASQQIDTFIKHKLSQIEIRPLIDKLVENEVSGLIQVQSFPDRSISHSSINFSGLKITGDQVSGGIIEKFGSTGIEDLATNVQMTVMDHATAFEGALWAPEATIKGKLVVEGDLIINGDIPTDSPVFKKLVTSAETNLRDNLNTEFFQGFTDNVFSRIQTEGLDLDKITQGGKDIIKGPQLGYHIVDTNIQRLGVVRDFQTSGENLLSETLYVTNGRVGVNTRDPSAALAVWDEEVEIIASKRGQDRGYIGLPRRQELVIGVNSKDNIVCDVDGGVAVNTITIGGTPMSSVKKVPNIEGTRGQIVWNEFPDIGMPIGWVCLGGHRWAKFGIVENA
jgi:hypothetical protein